MYNFVIPIKHIDLIKDMESHRNYLIQLIDSVHIQNCQKKIWVVCPSEYRIKDDRIKIIRLDLSKPEQSYARTDRLQYYRQIRLDKGARIKQVYNRINDCEWIIPLDDDDLLHRNYSEEVRNCKGDIFVIGAGYKWYPKTKALVLTNRFNEYCGTSIGFKKSLARKYENNDNLLELIGSHSEFLKIYKNIEKIDVPVVLYRLDNENSSQEVINKNESIINKIRKSAALVKAKYLYNEKKITGKEYEYLMVNFLCHRDKN